MRDAADPRTPVVIVTGFLGSGKTTLLNSLLSSKGLGRVAALVNDFGAINIDAALITEVADEVVQLTNGCVCCTINGDLLVAAERVLALEPPVEQIVVETSGLADPLGVGLTFLQTELRQRTVLEAVITVVDSANFALDLFSSDAAMAQIVHGDVIVLNKTDLVDASELASLERRIAIIKPRARTLRAEHGRIPFQAVMDVARVDGRPSVERAGQTAAGRHLAADGFEAHAFRFAEPISSPAFQAWLDEGLPPGVFRAKGIVRLANLEGSFLFQLCGSRAAFEPTSAAADGSELVFIGRDVDAGELATRLASCLVPVDGGRAPDLEPNLAYAQ
jgi:G3E family GTPase